MALYLELLGKSRVKQEENWQEFSWQMPSALLCYLACQDTWVTRDELATLLRPEDSEDVAKSRLRSLLHRVKKLSWAENLEVEKKRIRYLVESDVKLFCEAVEQKNWSESIRLYQGKFLSDVGSLGLIGLDDWFAENREMLHALWRDSVAARAKELVEVGELNQVSELLQKLLDDDPLDEEIVQLFLQCTQGSSESKQAFVAYEHFSKALAAEMALEPLAITTELAKKARADLGQVQDLPKQPLGSVIEIKPKAPKVKTGSFPKDLTPFVERPEDLQAITETLANKECRLLTLIGLGGTGKSRLGLYATVNLADHYQHGVCIVPLADVETQEELINVIMLGLGLAINGNDPQQQLLTYLNNKNLLLFLDNFEQLVNHAQWLNELLQGALGVQLLVSSRAALNLKGEWLYEVNGLSYPSKSSNLENISLEDFSAVQLFKQTAFRNGVTPDPNEYFAIARICQLVDGSPLAIEMAASWVRIMSIADIAAELEQDLGFLSASGQDVPERHHSMRAVFDTSWQHLSAQQQQALAALSVFRGGFDRTAAQKVAGAVARVLLELASKSLLRRYDTGRFDLHLLIRRFAAEKFSEDKINKELIKIEDLQVLQRAHAEYFLNLALEAAPHFTGAEQAKWLGQLQAEYHNVCAVFDWAEKAKEVKLGLDLAVAIWPFLVVHGHLGEGSEILEKLLALPQAQAYPELRAKATNALATLLNTKGDWLKARTYLEDILAIWQEIGDKHNVAKTLSTLGWTFIGLDNYTEARSKSEEALALHHSVKNLRGEALSLNNLGWCDVLEGDFHSANAYFQQSLNILKNSLNDRGSTHFILINLAWAQQYLGNYEKVKELLTEAESLIQFVRDKQIIGWMLCRQGSLVYDLGHAKEALKFFEKSLAYASEIGTAYHFVLLAPLAANVMREVGEVQRAQDVLEQHFSFCSSNDKRRLFADGLFAKGQLLEEANNLAEAKNAYVQSLEIYQDIKAKYAVPEVLESMAKLYILQSELERACQLLALATQLREKMEFPLPPRCHETYEKCLKKIHNELSREDFHKAWSQGEALDEDDLQLLLQAPQVDSELTAKTEESLKEVQILLKQEERGNQPPENNFDNKAVLPKNLTPPPFLEEKASLVKRTLFVGRTEELSCLQKALESVYASKGQVRLIQGGAGQGKSYLLQKFANEVLNTSPDLLVLTGYCEQQAGAGDPYLPFRDILLLLLGDVEAKWHGGLISTANAKLLWEAMGETVPQIAKHAPDLISSFSSGPTLLERLALAGLDKEPWFKEVAEVASMKTLGVLEQTRIITLYVSALKAIAKVRPILLILEDLHWVDVSSAELFNYLSRQVTESRILIIGSYKPSDVLIDETHPMLGIIAELQGLYGDISINLDEQKVDDEREFVNSYLDSEPNEFDDAFREAFFKHTQGHALFTAELLKAMKERGNVYQKDGKWFAKVNIDWQTLPAKIEGFIEAYVNRLPSNQRELLSIASVQGKVFIGEVIAQVKQRSEREVIHALSGEISKRHQLVRPEKMERLGEKRLSHYRFRHDLFQKHIYSKLDKAERAYLHEDIALVLERMYGKKAKKIAAQLAWHFEQSGNFEKTFEYLLVAGQQAQALGSNKEAIGYYERGLAIMSQLTITPKLLSVELGLQAGLGMALLPVEGFQSERVRITLEHALELCHQIGGTSSQLMTIYAGLAHYALFNSSLSIQTFLDCSSEFKAIANRQEDLAHLATAGTLLTLANFLLGYNDKAIDLGYSFLRYINFDQASHEKMIYHYTHDQRVILMPILSWALCFKGRLKEAKALMTKEPLTNFKHAASRAFFLGVCFTIYQLRNDFSGLKSIAEELLELADEYGYAFWKAWGLIYHGWAVAQLGQVETGVAEMQQGMTITRMAGGIILGSCSLAMLAEGLWLVGKHNDALDMLEEAFDHSTKRDELFYLSQLHCLKGKWLQELGAETTEVEHNLRQAIAVAEQQNASMLELRASLALAKYWQKSKKEESHSLLTKLLNRITPMIDINEIPEYAEAEEILARLGE